MSVPLLRPFAAGAVLAALLTGCGDDAPTSTAAGGDDARALDVAGGPGTGRGMPGTFGEIAAVDGDVLQVQNQMTGQVAVTVTGDTAITTQAAATVADVTEGVCVLVRSADTDASDATGSGDAPPTEIEATSVAVSPAGDEGCTGGFGVAGGPGGPDGGRPTDLPSDLPSDRPDGMRAGGRVGFGTIGQVSSVSDSGFVVDGPDGAVTVTVGTATVYTKQAAAEASALTVGRCVRVQGDADDTGAVTATSVQVSDQVDDQCGL